MPFNPLLPIDDSLIEAPELRGQFIGLFDLIQSIPAGPPGPAITSYVVDAVNTLNPGDNASVVASFEAPSVHFTFNIPRGADGLQGATFMSFVADPVNTLPAGSDATVSTNFDGTLFHFIFGIPRGEDGPAGATGAPGEVTTAQLNGAISAAVAGTAQNPSSVASFTGGISDPPTQAEIVALVAHVEELLNALKRS